ncbi:conserved hypothetical protein [Neospora caninum Liverpool]|uniref:Uncharacterized protein n=1 Tax=Neospora caninum (strain Liverpool) TaxID=572307 RepID=F0VAG2_NEOCL|nr:conserved hypothetical protein [Neospora caninum Liverpool]CBZ50651.1 conserved hypothetical protein [Neospora caninum Liverpool]CEL65263.1 TPA: hypothetical protein BN1204_011180 [Neospora caninum Liverpool]|eukprot:XP_003880684.1 conserved hypothetical protein [Neospora caninum Liverpool]
MMTERVCAFSAAAACRLAEAPFSLSHVPVSPVSLLSRPSRAISAAPLSLRRQLPAGCASLCFPVLTGGTRRTFSSSSASSSPASPSSSSSPASPFSSSSPASPFSSSSPASPSSSSSPASPSSSSSASPSSSSSASPSSSSSASPSSSSVRAPDGGGKPAAESVKKTGKSFFLSLCESEEKRKTEDAIKNSQELWKKETAAKDAHSAKTPELYDGPFWFKFWRRKKRPGARG